ncbi:hypothetical protein IWX48DRAFT_612144 [Phyllosticta citricarpa]
MHHALAFPFCSWVGLYTRRLGHVISFASAFPECDDYIYGSGVRSANVAFTCLPICLSACLPTYLPTYGRNHGEKKEKKSMGYTAGSMGNRERKRKRTCDSGQAVK